ncbi:MAG: hypothetical protein UY81_C0011G0003 [Candidatus Giovannonibacteria bacterium GW2011_GWA2_53_7]|uniref:Uncharacterized protein n=1 Tax=Candidatus Giovannonibacteria bacterium GW2011_GWA2_53_7 TaxID=1618650 RepID=A0A0G1Y070_9BACT|nr:MAG: hypothetical protein UY81_C0011G0003 [Candidatus Giovannonibacteria bacterium GW2011_GWA2_53_7]
MSERLKRIFVILGFVLVTASIATALYVVFFQGPSSDFAPVPPSETPSSEGTGEGLPSAGEGTPTVVSPEDRAPGALPEASPVADGGVTKTEAITTGRVVAPTLASDGVSMAYYDRTDGRFYTVTDEGEVERLSDKMFPKAETVSWNKTGDKAAIEFPDGSNVIYDFEDEKQTTLPSHWEDFSFSPVTNELVAKSIGLDPNNRSIVITSTDGSRTRAVAALGNNADKVTLDWSPNNQVIAFSDTGPTVSGFGRKMILPIGKNSENLPGITVEGINFKSQWSPQGNHLLFSSAGAEDDYRPMLWVVAGDPNAIGQQRRRLGLNTWADKCTFADNRTLYCAVPQALGPNTGLQRALADNVADSIYRVNIETGVTERVAIPEKAQSIDSLTVSQDGKRLFFTNHETGVLQQIQLK